MYIRLVVTYCKEGKLVPKEAHVDLNICNNDHILLEDCLSILDKKLPEIQKMIPTHLKNKDFDIIIYGDYLIGYDWDKENGKWSCGEPIFNVKQLGLPEDSRPIIKTS